MAKISNDFENNLKFLIDETGKNKYREELSLEIIMLRMRQKLDEKIKNKKEKGKEKDLKKIRIWIIEFLHKKIRNDMVNLMENNLKKKKKKKKSSLL